MTDPNTLVVTAGLKERKPIAYPHTFIQQLQAVLALQATNKAGSICTTVIVKQKETNIIPALYHLSRCAL